MLERYYPTGLEYQKKKKKTKIKKQEARACIQVFLI